MKVNIKTLTATREGVPLPLIGLSEDTLRNLQTALNPVPTEYEDIEYWDEVDTTPAFDSTAHTYDDTETFTVKPESKTVEVVRGIREKTQEELDAERKANIPQSLTAVQARLVLNGSGMRQAVEEYVATNQNFKDWWKYSTTIERNHPVLLEAMVALSLTDDQMDEIFIVGSKL